MLPAQTAPAAWNSEWDRAIIQGAVADLDRRFDPKENMLSTHRGTDYNYHSGLRDATVHPTRDSVTYALMLLEAGGAARVERAARVIDRTIALQDTDPKSRFYGIWGYFMEEPPAQMQPADFNWADFNGAQLLMIEARHGKQLPHDVRARMYESIRHAANSIRKRNVTMAYTNIAVQGTFVTLAAAALLEDGPLDAYARDRLRRFAQQVDITGSFDEYNSPTYIQVTLANLTRMRMVFQDEESRHLAARIEERAWLHLGKHWHAGTRQLAGPMSRCYSTDIGTPLWLQKALGGAIPFATLDDAKKHPGDGDVGILDFRCPPSLAPMFLKSGDPRQHREIFHTATAPLLPVEGTTWLDKDWCLGSVNRGNFWIQSRPLVAYWGGPERPAHYLQARLMHDDYDFSSGLLYTVQDRGSVLGLVTFQIDGGDKHPSLDRIKNGEFTASRLRLRFDIAGGPTDQFELKLRAIGMGDFKQPEQSTATEGNVRTISFDWFEPGQPRTIRWADLKTAYAVFTLSMGPRTDAGCQIDASAPNAKVTWGDLALQGRIAPGKLAEQDRAFSATIAGRSVPMQRLSDEKLA